MLRIEDGWITSSQNFYPDTKDKITDSELLSIFIESYVIENKHRKIMNLLFHGDISKETKGFLNKLKSPQIFIQT